MRTSPAAPGQLPPSLFDELFLSIYPRLVAILRRMLGDSGRAEELASEAFLKLYRTQLPPAAKDNVAGWVYRTAVNLGIDELRAHTRHDRLREKAYASHNDESHFDDGLQLLLRAEKQQRVRVVLAKIKPDWAQLLLLRASGNSYRELAQHLDIAPASVGTMLLRAEAAFEKCYVELFGEGD